MRTLHRPLPEKGRFRAQAGAMSQTPGTAVNKGLTWIHHLYPLTKNGMIRPVSLSNQRYNTQASPVQRDRLNQLLLVNLSKRGGPWEQQYDRRAEQWLNSIWSKTGVVGLQARGMMS